MLSVQNLAVNYGGIRALKGISLHVPERKIVTLIGANGAGKSTTLRTISGLVRARGGNIRYMGNDVTKTAAKDIVRRGITMVPEGRQVFADMTVAENIRIGAFLHKDKVVVKRMADYVYELFPRLLERKNQLAGTLSGGEQQMLAVARALMARPKLLMMDEPSLGLAPLIVKDIFATIQRINEEENVTILLIEQNAHMALKVSDYGYVMVTGTIGLEGPCSELLQNEGVRELYLGKA